MGSLFTLHDTLNVKLILSKNIYIYLRLIIKKSQVIKKITKNKYIL